ncbi:MAG: hypothetical protein OEU90_10350 [Gammaproteobacteria bacterium]|nr:hypothetical protein [Gammaproteobacteria bacterium]MDH3751946.1 hypothetical protein [Gammaproteobacteria bacterium]MDH3805858.1 hypothetical protein [Gammaproteobacteria bacterium]
MKKYLIIVAVLVIGGGIYAMLQENENLAGRVFGKDVTWDSIAGQRSPSEEFAQRVDQDVTEYLTARFAIDMSDSAVRSYMAVHAPDAFSSDQTRRDQQVTARIVKALEDVRSGGTDAFEAYATHELGQLMPEDRWTQIVQSTTEQSLEAMRTFAESDTSAQTDAKVDSLRWIYILRRVRESICDLPETQRSIRSRLDRIHGPEEAARMLGNASINHFECLSEANAYIAALLDEEVVVMRSELQGYDRYLQIIDRVVRSMADDS